MLSPQVIVVTGATAGLGLATAKALRESATEPTTIILTSRDAVKGQASVDQNLEVWSRSVDVKVVVKQLNLDYDASVEQFRAEVQEEYGKVDVLIHNATAHLDLSIGEGPGKISVREAFNTSCNTNMASTYLFTHAMMPLLFAPSTRRMVFISTGITSLGEHHDEKYSINKGLEAGWPKAWHFNVTTYRTSKTGLNMMALEWARILRNDNFKIHILDPGLLATRLGGADPDYLKKMGAADPSVGGEFVRDVVKGKWDNEVEKLLSKDGVLPW